MTPDAFTKWLQESLIGDRIEYYRGFLVRDIDNMFVSARERRDENMKSRAILMARTREMAQNAAGADAVALVQERHGDNDYSYMAVRL